MNACLLRVQRGEEWSHVKDIILSILSHPLFSFFMQHKAVEETSSLSLREGSRFDSVTCLSLTLWPLVFTLLFSLYPLGFLEGTWRLVPLPFVTLLPAPSSSQHPDFWLVSLLPVSHFPSFLSRWPVIILLRNPQ